MKIILGIEDVKKLITESYNGINEVIIKEKDIEFVLDVDGDTFYKKTAGNLKQTAQKIVPVDISGDINFEARVAEKNARQAAMNAEESTIPGVKKTVEEKNNEAKQKGLMSTGRGSERVIKKF